VKAAPDACRSAEGPLAAQRLDKWLWFARVTKSRTLAADLVLSGKVRINRARAEKPSQTVKAGDVLTINVNRRVRVLRVSGLGERRGPAQEASTLYLELTPAEVATKPSRAIPHAGAGDRPEAVAQAGRPAGSGRPTKRERRETDRLRARSR